MRPIEEIAREAGLLWGSCTPSERSALEKMRAIVRAEALEEAAAVCASVGAYYAEGDAWEVACIANIRALKDAPHA